MGQPTEDESDGLMRLLECDFEDLERQIEDGIGGMQEHQQHVEHAQTFIDLHRVALSMACLQLRTYYLFEFSASKTRKDGLLKAYTTAINFIAKVAEADVKTEFVTYAPKVFSVMLITAGLLVMKIINSSYCRYVDIEGGKFSFNKVLALLRRASLEDNDLNGRGGKSKLPRAYDLTTLLISTNSYGPALDCPSIPQGP